MNIDRIRRLSKKLSPFLLAGAVLGTAGAAVAHRYLASDCCASGSSCCHPGSPCCHGHHAAAGVASQGLAQR